MNKTVTVNIGGIVFHIEEQAYERLLRYLESIKGYFRNTEGSDDIINDIENRIAEMFQDNLKGTRQVIVSDDVEKVIDVMGRPEQFSEEAQPDAPFASKDTVRRLFRDPDDKLIGGVCSGISHYFGFDPIWIRLLFLISFLFFGSGILLYIILLVIIPKATTPAEKLQMKGEPVNIGNIRNTVRDGVDDLKEKFADLGKEAKNMSNQSTLRRIGGFIERLLEAVILFIVAAFKILIRVLGILLLVVAVGFLVTLVIALLAVLGVTGVSLPVYISNLVMTASQQYWIVAGLFLAFALPLLLLVTKLLLNIFDARLEWKWFGRSAIVLFIVGLGILIVTAANIASEFNRSDRSKFIVTLKDTAIDKLYLDVDRSTDYSKDKLVFDDDFAILSHDDSTIYFSNIKFDIQKSSTGQFQLVEYRHAYGRSKKDAYNNSRNISYSVAQEDSLIVFDEYFRLGSGTKYRNQKLKYILYVPVGASVYLSYNMKEIIYDIDNVTNTYDGDMVNHTWTMTEVGLECVDCFDIDRDYKKDDDERSGRVVLRKNNREIIIDDRRIEIEGKDNRITIE